MYNLHTFSEFFFIATGTYDVTSCDKFTKKIGIYVFSQLYYVKQKNQLSIYCNKFNRTKVPKDPHYSVSLKVKYQAPLRK